MFWPSCSTMHGLRPWHAHWKFQQILCPLIDPMKVSWFFSSAGTVLTWVKTLVRACVTVIDTVISLRQVPVLMTDAMKDLWIEKMLVDAIHMLWSEPLLTFSCLYCQWSCQIRGKRSRFCSLSRDHITCTFYAYRWLNVLRPRVRFLPWAMSIPHPTCHNRVTLD